MNALEELRTSGEPVIIDGRAVSAETVFNNTLGSRGLTKEITKSEFENIVTDGLEPFIELAENYNGQDLTTIQPRLQRDQLNKSMEENLKKYHEIDLKKDAAILEAQNWFLKELSNNEKWVDIQQIAAIQMAMKAGAKHVYFPTGETAHGVQTGGGMPYFHELIRDRQKDVDRHEDQAKDAKSFAESNPLKPSNIELVVQKPTGEVITSKGLSHDDVIKRIKEDLNYDEDKELEKYKEEIRSGGIGLILLNIIE